MANVLTDPTATFGATTVWAATKVNNTPRAEADAETYAIAQWANEIDNALKDVNAFFLGSEGGGASSTTITLLGGLSIAESAAVLGSALAVGSTSEASTTLSILNTNAGTGHLYFGDAGSATIGGLDYSHTANSLELRTGGAARVKVDSSALAPSSHNVTNLGGSGKRWASAYVDALYANASLELGSGSGVDLTINGSASGGSEGRIVFEHAGTPVSLIQSTNDSDGNNLEVQTAGLVSLRSSFAMILPRSDTATLNGLSNTAGLLAYDTDLDSVMYHNGAGWLNLSTTTVMGAIGLGATEAFLSATNPAIYGETAGSDPVIYYSSASTQSAHWTIQLPAEYDAASNLDLTILWTGTSAAAGNVSWVASFRRYVAGADLSLSGAVDNAFTEAGPPAIYESISDTITLSQANIDGAAAGDLLRISITRVGGDAADTYTGSAALLGIQLAQ